MDGGPNRRKKAAFSNFPVVVWTLPKTGESPSDISQLSKHRACSHLATYNSWLHTGSKVIFK